MDERVGRPRRQYTWRTGGPQPGEAGAADTAITPLLPAPLGRPTLWQRLDSHELRIVRATVVQARPPALRAVVVALNHLSNGWLYLLIGLIVLVLGGAAGLRVVVVAAAAVGLAFCVYPLIKGWLGRLRPCDVDPQLKSVVRALDRYSCPSGHCMTAAAVGVTLVWAWPAAAAAIVLGWLVIAWSRLSVGHHYPSDVVLGGLLGTAASLLVSRLLL